MDIIFNPSSNEENRYIQLLVGQLRANGYRIHPLDTFFSSWAHFSSIKLVHLNWFENIDDSNIFKALRSFLRKMTVLMAIRLSGKPLVWTLHNRISHEKGMPFFNRMLTRLLVRWSDVIVIHSAQSETVLAAYGATASERMVYVPHPHFIGVYGDAVTAAPRRDAVLRLLFIGMVKPYKNLELLIDTVARFGHRVQLTIAGKATDEDYRRRLAERAHAIGNVAILPYFIPDDELAGLLCHTDAVVLPYDLASSLNSGTVMLAFSYKKTAICPEIGTVSELGSLMEETFSYRYGTEAQHRKALAQQIERALALRQNDPAALVRMGERLYRHVAATNSPQRVGEVLDRIYGDVFSERRRRETGGL